MKRGLLVVLVFLLTVAFAAIGNTKLSEGSHDGPSATGGSYVPYYHRILGQKCSRQIIEACHHEVKRRPMLSQN